VARNGRGILNKSGRAVSGRSHSAKFREATLLTITAASLFIFAYIVNLDVLAACCYPPGYPSITWDTIPWTSPARLGAGNWLGLLGILAFLGMTLPVTLLKGIRSAIRFAAFVGFVYEATLALTVPHVMGIQVLDILQWARIGPPTYSGYYFFSNSNIWFACTVYLLWPLMNDGKARVHSVTARSRILPSLRVIYEIYGFWVCILAVAGLFSVSLYPFAVGVFSVSPSPFSVGFNPENLALLPGYVGPWPLVFALALPAILLLCLDQVRTFIPSDHRSVSQAGRETRA